MLQQFEQVKSLVEKQQQQKTQMLAQSEQLAKNILRFEQQKQILEQQAAQIQNQSQLDAIDQLLHAKQDAEAQQLQREQSIIEVQLQLDDLRIQHQAAQTELNQHKADIQVLSAEQKHLKQLVGQSQCLKK